MKEKIHTIKFTCDGYCQIEPTKEDEFFGRKTHEEYCSNEGISIVLTGTEEEIALQYFELGWNTYPNVDWPGSKWVTQHLCPRKHY